MISIKSCAVLSILFKLAASTTLYFENKCPVVEPVPKLDFNGLQGTWYEQARYDNDFQVLEHCVVVSFTKENGKDIFNVQGIVDDKPLAFSGPVNAASNGTGVIFFHSSVYKNIEKSDEIAVAILALDVNNYAVLYDCKYDEETKKHHDYLWILSRSKTYSGVTKTFVDGLLDRSPFVDKSKLVWQDFSPKSCNR